jgi:Cu(I)/Ag(I) efflux system protein CusF
MKITKILAILALGVMATSVVHGQKMKMEDMSKMDMSPKSDKATHNAVGVVKAVDQTKGSVTFAHEPVKSLNWPSMTMTFQVKDKALLDKLPPGKKVDFEFVQQGKDYVVTAVR